jgi:hypothetical protein
VLARINKGYKINISESVVYHVGGATYNKIQKHFEFQKLLIDVDKNLPENKLYPILLGRMVLDGMEYNFL